MRTVKVRQNRRDEYRMYEVATVGNGVSSGFEPALRDPKGASIPGASAMLLANASFIGLLKTGHHIGVLAFIIGIYTGRMRNLSYIRRLGYAW